MMLQNTVKSWALKPTFSCFFLKFFIVGMLLTVLHSTAGNCSGYHPSSKKYLKWGCNLTEVPTDIPAEAEKVWLENNKISQIQPGVFTKMKGCINLWLYKNNLTRLQSGTFDGLESLEELYLYQNQISQIEERAFLGLSRCWHLSLEDNRLTHIKREMFKGLEALTELNLKENYLQHLGVGAFDHLKSLNQLILMDNLLTSLDLGAFEGWFYALPNATLTLFINKNPFECDSKMYWVKHARVSLTGEYQGKPVNNPSCENFPGVDWDDVTLHCSGEITLF